jgi:beta-N-acetylhexosaminidase
VLIAVVNAALRVTRLGKHPKLRHCDPSSVVASMTTRDKLAQQLMVGVTGGADARAVVVNQHVGGIFIRCRTDLTMLTNGELADIAKLANPLGLAVAIDSEGGRVDPLSSLIGPTSSARAVAQTHTAAEVYRRALQRGKSMHKLGITIDFAPVVDVTDAPSDTVIGDRSFSADSAVVTKFAGAYARGLRDAGVLPVLKHFPGHGRASGDSHLTQVTTPSLEDLQNIDLMPYRALVAETPVGVMMGHMVVPGLTGSAPASLSAAAIDLLRHGTGYAAPPFDGPVFTDDLSTMRAITDRYPLGEAALTALQAGNDIALSMTTNSVAAVLDRLELAVQGGELNEDKVDASVLRIAEAKALTARRGH